MTDEDDEETAVDTQIIEAEAKRRLAVAKMIIAECEAIELVNGKEAPTEVLPRPRSGSGWHHEHGWLPSTLNKLEELKAFDEACNEGAVARRRISEQLAAFHGFTDLKPGTWTTLPDGVGVDEWMFDITDPEEKIVTAGADRQTKVNLFPCEGGYVGLWRGTALGMAALITGNLSIANNEQIEAAQASVRSRPELKAALKQRIDTLFA